MQGWASAHCVGLAACSDKDSTLDFCGRHAVCQDGQVACEVCAWRRQWSGVCESRTVDVRAVRLPSLGVGWSSVATRCVRRAHIQGYGKNNFDNDKDDINMEGCASREPVCEIVGLSL